MPRRCGSNEYYNVCFYIDKEKDQYFLVEELIWSYALHNWYSNLTTSAIHACIPASYSDTLVLVA